MHYTYYFLLLNTFFLQKKFFLHRVIRIFDSVNIEGKAICKSCSPLSNYQYSFFGILGGKKQNKVTIILRIYVCCVHQHVLGNNMQVWEFALFIGAFCETLKIRFLKRQRTGLTVQYIKSEKKWGIIFLPYVKLQYSTYDIKTNAPKKFFPPTRMFNNCVCFSALFWDAEIASKNIDF